MILRLAVAVMAIVVVSTAAQTQPPKPTAAPIPCPDLDATPTSGRIELSEGFMPGVQRIPVKAGGGLDLERCRPNWTGWVSQAMNVQVHYRSTGAKTLTIAIESKTDTVLVVNDPSATWHFDDDSGSNLDGKVRIEQARQGRYDIWVGTYARGENEDAIVVISEE